MESGWTVGNGEWEMKVGGQKTKCEGLSLLTDILGLPPPVCI
jgi:hypothetical protein